MKFVIASIIIAFYLCPVTHDTRVIHFELIHAQPSELHINSACNETQIF